MTRRSAAAAANTSTAYPRVAEREPRQGVDHAAQRAHRGRRAVALVERGQLGARLLGRRPGREPAHQVLGDVGQVALGDRRAHRGPQLGPARPVEPLRHHADDGVGHAVVLEREAAAHHVARAPEPLLPGPVAEHHDRVGPGHVVLGPERAAEHRPRAQDREEVARDERAAQAGDLAAGGAVLTDGLGHGALVAVERDARERARPAGELAAALQPERPVVHAVVGGAAGEHDQPVLVGDGQPAQEERVGHREHGRREANAEGQGQDRGPREAGRAAEAPGAGAEVVEQ
jgi:hypothetical protein